MACPPGCSVSLATSLFLPSSSLSFLCFWGAVCLFPQLIFRSAFCVLWFPEGPWSLCAAWPRSPLPVFTTSCPHGRPRALTPIQLFCLALLLHLPLRSWELLVDFCLSLRTQMFSFPCLYFLFSSCSLAPTPLFHENCSQSVSLSP